MIVLILAFALNQAPLAQSLSLSLRNRGLVADLARIMKSGPTAFESAHGRTECLWEIFKISAPVSNLLTSPETRPVVMAELRQRLPAEALTWWLADLDELHAWGLEVAPSFRAPVVDAFVRMLREEANSTCRRQLADEVAR